MLVKDAAPADTDTDTHPNNTNTADTNNVQYSHGDEKPVTSLLQSWLFGIMLPAGALAYRLSGGSWWMAFASSLAVPIYAIAQGAVGILHYRFNFGDAPLPLSPSHGVVVVTNNHTDNGPTILAHGDEGTTKQQQQQQSVPLRKTASFPLSLGCQCGGGSKHPVYCEMTDTTTATTTATTTTTTGRTTFSDDQSRTESSSSLDEMMTPAQTQTTHTTQTQNDHTQNDHTHDNEQESDTRRPVRLLVIGDSLAVGVGQAHQCTPILPEVIAKTLSKQLDGRVVYWTCHGAPGASTGWIVRELERGVTYLQKDDNNTMDDDEIEEEQYQQQQEEQQQKCAIEHSNASEIQSNCSDTDDSSSDDSSSSLGPQHTTIQAAAKHQRAIWRERLAQHRKRFDPEALGPYDIVVVMTGSNDLKSAFFPFLLTGEDAEFRRQAVARGGNYTKELRRLLETLNTGMRCQLQSIRCSVEAATETVLKKVLVVGGGGGGVQQNQNQNSNRKLDARKEASPETEKTDTTTTAGSSSSVSKIISDDHHLNERFAAATRQFPLVVLPGLPSRALPILRTAPLRWLAVPIVDILDMHKRRFAKSHPGEVLFVPPPSVDELAQYESCTGHLWRQRCQEDTALSLRDIRRQTCRRIEGELREYYDSRDERISTGVGLRTRPAHKKWYNVVGSLFGFGGTTPAPGTSVFSVDQIHPTDDGYDFWGRYIGNAIADEWRVHPNRQPLE